MKKAIAVIGEGITEKYYIESLKGMSPFSILPQELGRKASNINTLKKEIDKAIKDGFDEVYCLIDMDGKKDGISKNNYDILKSDYHNKTHGNRRKGIQCKVIFVETERCIELWFLYHFTSTAITKEFRSYKALEKALQKYRPNYEKTDKYFKSLGGLYQNLTEKGRPKGSIDQAIKNGKNSIASKERDNRNYTYSEMHILFQGLKIETK